MRRTTMAAIGVIITLIVLASRCASQVIEPDTEPAYVCVDKNPDGTPCSHPSHEP